MEMTATTWFPFSPSSFNFKFDEKCYLHARYLLLPTCPFAQQNMSFSAAYEAVCPTSKNHRL